MNLPKLSEAKLHNLAKQENNASVRAGNPRSFSRKSNSEIVRLAGETTASPKTIVLGRPIQ